MFRNIFLEFCVKKYHFKKLRVCLGFYLCFRKERSIKRNQTKNIMILWLSWGVILFIIKLLKILLFTDDQSLCYLFKSFPNDITKFLNVNTTIQENNIPVSVLQDCPRHKVHMFSKSLTRLQSDVQPFRVTKTKRVISRDVLKREYVISRVDSI
jgi:hypothetical protein